MKPLLTGLATLLSVTCSAFASPPPPTPITPMEQRFLEDEAANQRLFDRRKEADALFEQRNYSGASVAYKTLSKERLRSACGNAGVDWRYDNEMRQAMCLEHLDRYDEAVRLYFFGLGASSMTADKTAPSRLANLYAGTGQLADLNRILDQWDKMLLERKGDYPVTEDSLPSRSLRTLLELHGLERSSQWAKLVLLLPTEASGARPENPEPHVEYYRSAEAARLLARHPRQTVPVLLSRLEDPQGINPAWLYYALGLAKTPQAITALRRASQHLDVNPHRESVIYALTVAGREGKDLLEELERTGRYTYYIKQAAHISKKHEVASLFPPVPRDLRLPRTISVLAMAE